MIDSLDSNFLKEEALSFHFDGKRCDETMKEYKECIDKIPIRLCQCKAFCSHPFWVEGDRLLRLHDALAGFERNIKIFSIDFEILYSISTHSKEPDHCIYLLYHNNEFHIIHNDHFIDILKKTFYQ